MSGHSKWSTIKHKKAANDAKRAQQFTKVARIITVAAKQGGGDPAMNPALRKAVDTAHSINMPNSNIERAISRGTGEGGEAELQELMIEAYGPEGTAMLIEAITDNKNRTVSEIRHILGMHEGRFADGGGVARLFARKNVITLEPAEGTTRDAFELDVIDAGAEETEWSDQTLLAYIDPQKNREFQEKLRARNIAIKEVDIEMRPKSYIETSESAKKKLRAIFEALDDHDDVQNIYTNTVVDEAAE